MEEKGLQGDVQVYGLDSEVNNGGHPWEGGGRRTRVLDMLLGNDGLCVTWSCLVTGWM